MDSADNSMETCPICQDLFRDPVMAADGYPYCRHCIGKWVTGKQEWTSPLTGQVHYGEASMTPDYLRAGQARDALRKRVDALEGWQRFLHVGAASFGSAPLCTAAQCAAVLTTEMLRSPRVRSGVGLLVLLEVCWRAQRLESFPAELLMPLSVLERDGAQRFVQRGVWHKLLVMAAERYRRSPSPELRDAALACRAHVLWRSTQQDGIFVPEARGPRRQALLFTRVPWNEPSNGRCQWRTKHGHTLTHPALPRQWICSNEDADVEISHANAHAHWYRSSVPVRWRGQRLWRRRRAAEAPPFPDSSGTDSDSDSDETPEQLDEELGALTTLSIWETPVRALPDGFEYIARVCDDECDKSDRHLAIANEALVAGLLHTLPQPRRKARKTHHQ